MTELRPLEWQKFCATQLPVPLLYVDADAPFVDEVKESLSPLGYKITSVPTAADALQFQNDTPTFLVIINHTLPDGSGLDLLKELLLRNPKLKTVFITSPETEHQAADALRLGATCYINNEPRQVFYAVLPALLERALLREAETKLKSDLKIKLKQSQQRLSQAVSVSEIGFWEWDETRNAAHYYSPELLHIYEMNESDVKTGHWTTTKDLKHIHPDDYANYRDRTHFDDSTKDRFEVEFRIVKKDGSIAHMREIGQAIRDENHNIIRSYGTVQDITGIKLTEKKLKKALNEAENANRTKASFLASMSHELRTPLNAILGFSEILVGQHFGTLGSERYIDYALDIHKSGTHLLNLISNILDISSAETGQLELNKERLELNQVIKDCYDAVEPSFSKAGIKTRLNITQNLSPLMADGRAIRQVLLNVLSNAAKFTPQNGSVEIILEEIDRKEAGQDLPGKQAHISIQDNGIGIDQKSLSQLLKPFSRLNTDPHLSQEGTGLGLAIVKSLTEAHNGIMEIDSEPGQGTTVHLYLPLKMA